MSIKIGIDAGHGLYTSGKQTPDGVKEWTLNDNVRDYVVSILSAYDCEIIHTDNDEGKTDEALTSRLSKYQKAGVSAFVSIHHNAFTGKWNNATGVEVFTDNNPTKADVKLANCIYKRLVENTGLTGRGVKRCDFLVINQDKIPAVLVEGGFMDGTKDYKYITSEEGQKAYAQAVADGLIEFLNLKKKKTTKKETTAKKETTTKGLYRVRAAWSAPKTQTGAFSDLDNAIAQAKKDGLNVYDAKGKEVYTYKAAVKTVKEGAKVKVKRGAKDYNGKSVASFVYNNVYRVDELNGKRAVLDMKGICTAFHIDNLIVQ